MPVTYIQGAELPDILVTWRDSDGAIINFSSGWTFTLRLGQLGQAAILTKTDLVGAATAPNLTISWSNTEIENLAAQTYTMQIIARHVATGKDRKMTDSLTITPQVLAP
jgi:hypothetical protein